MIVLPPDPLTFWPVVRLVKLPGMSLLLTAMRMPTSSRSLPPTEAPTRHSLSLVV